MYNLGMRLLSFTVGNCFSIREQQTMTFAKGLDSPREPSGGWDSATTHVSIIHGANASGKSNFLAAMRFGLQAIQGSATVWRAADENQPLPYRPFLLDETSRAEPSFFEWDFVVEGVRYVYGFELDAHRVHSEWLSRVPSARWSPVFSRTPEAVEWTESAVSKKNQKAYARASDKELLFSVAFRDELPLLGRVARELVMKIKFLPTGSDYEDMRINNLIQQIRNGDLNLEDVSSLLVAADTGITRVVLDEKRIPAKILEQVKRVLGALNSPDDASGDKTRQLAFKFSDEELEDIAYSLRFIHRSEGGEVKLSLADQSDGTKSWLSIAPTVLSVLRNGDFLVADELDASLHVTLLFMIVSAFADPDVNINNAQLLLTTHNTNLLENRKKLHLIPADFWFAEKSPAGSSSYYSLDSFDKRDDANYERRYLSGRYGAIPEISPSTLKGLIRSGVDHDE